MKQIGLSYYNDLMWPLIGLILFFSVFMIKLVVTFLSRKKEDYFEVQNIVFENDALKMEKKRE
jgi:hypothetical protein